MDNQSLERTSPERTQRVFSAIFKISAAFNVSLSRETQAIYANEILHLSENELHNAVTATVREWTEPSKMPPLAFILERAIDTVMAGRRFASVSDIDPERCPNGWTPEQVFSAHLTQEKIRGGARRPMPQEYRGEDMPSFDALGARSGVSRADIARWMEEGKAKGRAKLAELEADPSWRELAARFGVKGYGTHRDTSEAACAERNGPTRVPVDQQERAVWARQMAVTQGWIQPEEREPGMEG